MDRARIVATNMKLEEGARRSNDAPKRRWKDPSGGEKSATITSLKSKQQKTERGTSQQGQQMKLMYPECGKNRYGDRLRGKEVCYRCKQSKHYQGHCDKFVEREDKKPNGWKPKIFEKYSP